MRNLQKRILVMGIGIVIVGVIAGYLQFYVATAPRARVKDGYQDELLYVPLHPDAAQVKAEKRLLQRGETIDQVTTFLVGSRPAEIQQYYRQHIPQPRWIVGKRTWDRVVTFGLNDGGIEKTQLALTFEVRTLNHLDGQTQVELDLWGFDNTNADWASYWK